MVPKLGCKENERANIFEFYKLSGPNLYNMIENYFWLPVSYNVSDFEPAIENFENSQIAIGPCCLWIFLKLFCCVWCSIKSVKMENNFQIIIFFFIFVVKLTYLPDNWHCLPRYPGLHIHEFVLLKSLQLPPFLHNVLLTHKPTTPRKKIKLWERLYTWLLFSSTFDFLPFTLVFHIQN